jgi:hypothetical protein
MRSASSAEAGPDHRDLLAIEFEQSDAEQLRFGELADLFHRCQKVPLRSPQLQARRLRVGET